VDRKVANRIAKALGRIGVDYFLDEKDVAPGDDLMGKITHGLANCSVFLVLLSPASLTSQWVQFEIGHATALGKIIIPFLMHPSLTLPVYLQRFHYVTRLAEVEAHLKSLLHSTAASATEPNQQTETDVATSETYKKELSATIRKFKFLVDKLEVLEPVSLMRHLELVIINMLQYAAAVNVVMTQGKLHDASFTWTEEEKDKFHYLCFLMMVRGYLLDRFISKNDFSADVLPELPEWKTLTTRWDESVLREGKWVLRWSDSYTRDLVDTEWSDVESVMFARPGDDPRSPLMAEVLKWSVLQGMIARRFLMLGAPEL